MSEPVHFRRTSPETLAFAVLVACAAVMAAGYAIDVIGLRLQPVVLAVVFAVALLGFARTGVAGRASRLELGCCAGVFVAVAAYLLWLASPPLLPVTIGPDVVHHLQLIHVIQRTHRLAHDPALSPYLLEMMNYTPGSHILAAVSADWLRLDALRVIQPMAASFIALKMAMLYLVALRAAASFRSAPIVALAAPLLAFVPAVYTLGSSFHFFFFAQVVSETFAIGLLLAAVCWEQSGERRFLVAFAACGAGVFLAWPVWLGPGVLVLVVAIVRRSMPWRARLSAAFLALMPIAVVAAVHIALHAEGGRILSSAGAVTAPSVQGFGAGFLVCAAAGIVLTVVRARAALAVVVFLGVILAQAAALAVLVQRSGSSSFYMPFKMMFLAVLPAAVLGAIAFSVAVDAASARLPSLRQVFAMLPLVVVAWLLSGRLPSVRPTSPITEPAYAAGLWARDHLDPACVDYFSTHWLTGYWLHLDVLGNPRVSDRMREETFEFRDTVGRWLEGRGLRYAIVQHPDDIPRELRPQQIVLRTFSSTTIVQNTRGRCR